MAEQNKPFVITDRRKFTLDGELRPDADPSPEREARAAAPEPVAAPPAHEPPLEFPSHSVMHEPEPAAPSAGAETDPELPSPPTANEISQAEAAYRQTADRLDAAVRAANPGADRPPTVSFEQIIQSIYMTTIMQLGGTTQEGQQPQVDLMGARQSVDMLGVLAEKTKGNLTPAEMQMIDSALFEVRMGFLEVTQALARQAAARNQPPGVGSAPGRPSIVR
jgi:hypothetical protein